MIIKTAWKNIWRNKVRSLVVIASVVVGVFAGVYSIAIMNGMTLQRVRSVLNDQIGHIQITQKGFRINNDASLTVNNTQEIIDAISKLDGVEHVTQRTLVSGMINSTAQSAGVQIIGIDPEKDREVFDLFDYIMPETGRELSPIDDHKIIIGQSLADHLHLIRYKVNQSLLDSLIKDGLDEELVTKLATLDGTMYNTKKLFEKALKKVLSPGELTNHKMQITERARSFRKRARLSLTFLDKDNHQTGGVFRIGGLYNIDDKMFEQSNVFVLNSTLKSLSGLGQNECHKIIIRISDIDQTDELKSRIAKEAPGLETLSWKEIRTELAMTTEMVTQFYIIFMAIILAALAFGIVNTMLMVVLERTKEIGMLTAIGMNRSKVFSMIMLESVFLSLIGGIGGMLISKCIIHLTSLSGINLSMYADAFQSMGYAAIIYPEVDNQFFVIVTVLIILTGVLSSVYPAIKALKLNPADAIRTE